MWAQAWFVSLPLDAALQGIPKMYFKVRVSVRVVKHWHKLPASVVTALSVNVFKEKLEKDWAEVYVVSSGPLGQHL